MSILLLDVPFSEKDEAKNMGALWNPDIKKWYVRNRKDYHKFTKWFCKGYDSNLIICDHIYVIEATHKCFKCSKKTKVISFGIENYIMLYVDGIIDDENNFEVEYVAKHYKNEINIVSEINPLPNKILEYIQEKYNYKMTYSKFRVNSYLANCCDHCNTLQGDYYLFSEVNSPFFLDSRQKVSKLKLYKIDLFYDIPVCTEVNWSSSDYLIKKYGQMYSTDLKV